MAAGVYRQALSIVQQRLLDTKQLQEEYKNVVIRDLSIEHTVEQSQKPENGPRNRYLNVLPYDYNGVRISGPGSGYINASSIACDEGGVQCNYIAAQGPISSTVEQFWRMCLEQDCPAVVMLTNFVERGVAKCAQYFPLRVGDVLTLPTIEVKTVEVTQAAENKLTVRVLQVRGTVEGRQRTMQLTHYHYHAWPDHGAPEESYPIRCMCDALPRHRGGSSKVVVHCSAGIGRTGTFIVIDMVRLQLRRLCLLAEQGKAVDPAAVHQALAIPELVHLLRQQRMGMVQTVDQYVFIYHALKEELTELLSQAR